jgi:methylenetetrahydrofolate--tRNA-(uracil-5-)-methyltransferase
MPIEEMASRHKDALRHGPMKPMGIENPRGGIRPYAVVQLRQDNSHATLFNMVGFQTRMKYTEQNKVFRMIPGLKNASFIRYGSMHRNTYVNGPALLDHNFKVGWEDDLYIIGQLSGVEGYLESASTGTYLGFVLSREINGKKVAPLPATTAIGALINHVVESDIKDYQPMKINWGIFPQRERVRKRIKDETSSLRGEEETFKSGSSKKSLIKTIKKVDIICDMG